jgi:lipoyl(octanoyl) transferase
LKTPDSNPENRNTMELVDLGRMSWDEAYELQLKAVEEVVAGGAERVHLVEHPNVFTLGRRADEANLLAQDAVAGGEIVVRRINRGGDITYHGPGQLVGYPHIDLRRRNRDLHRYLRNLESALIEASAIFGVRGYRREGLTGVWTDGGKLASIGVGVRQWVTFHGFALNVSTDLSYFNWINPCGIKDCPMTSLEQESGSQVPMGKVKQAVGRTLRNVLGCA